MKKINVLIVDGRKLAREGVVALLKHQDIRVVGEAGEVQDAARLISPLRVQVAVLNVGPSPHLPAAAVSHLVAAHPGVRVIVLAWSISARGMRELLKAGAAGCLTRECTSEELIAAIRTVAAGKLYLSPQLTDVMIEGYVTNDRAHRALRPLAPREVEILRRISSGQTTKEIAHALEVSSKTVETHRRRIMIKLDLHSVAELTQYAVMEGLIPFTVGVSSVALREAATEQSRH